MLNETASSVEDRPVLRHTRPLDASPNEQYADLRKMVATVLMIERESFPTPGDETEIAESFAAVGQNSRVVAVFEGRLLLDSEQAYAQLDEQFRTIDYIPLFRTDKEGRHLVIAMSGRIQPKEGNWWLNAVFFIATLLSVLWLGWNSALNEIAATNLPLARQLAENGLLEIWRGLPYAVSIMLILGAHELGHYFAARYHKISVSLPYFIPAPPIISIFGTLGAFIRLREPMRNRKTLLDVGASGPLMGMVFAIPILIIGLLTSPRGPIPAEAWLEGNSFLYALIKTILFGEFLPNGVIDVSLNQVAWAGWTGMLLTALNLIPIGQLDGGHILYSLVGERARWLYFPLLGAMIFLVFRSETWLLWLFLIFLLGRLYATPLDMITPLDPRRRFIGILSLVVFVVTFVPEPLTFVTATGPAVPSNTVMLPVAFVVLALWMRRRRG